MVSSGDGGPNPVRHIWRALLYGLLACLGVIGIGTGIQAAIQSGASVIYTGTDIITLPAGVIFNAPTVNVTSAFSAVSSAAFSGVITPTQITSSQNNYNPTGLATANFLRLSTSATWSITGLAGGATGRWHIVHNIGTQNIVFPTESVSSTDVNRFDFPADLTLVPKAVMILHYDVTTLRWRTLTPSFYGWADLGVRGRLYDPRE